MNTTKALYKVTYEGQEFYATHIGTDSKGSMIMEERGAGKIHTVDESYVEEVLPYTFCVRMNKRDQHFQGVEGKVEVGDVLLFTSGGVDNFQLAVVKKVNTKHKGARLWKGKKLKVEDI